MNISNFLMGKNNPSHNELDFINTNTKCDTTFRFQSFNISTMPYYPTFAVHCFHALMFCQ